MGRVAPVCNVNVPQPVVQPSPPALPAIPVATNLATAIQAINVMRQAINTMNNNIPPNNQNSQNPTMNGFTTKQNQQQNTPQKSGFVQVSVVKNTVRITNPDNPDQYVDVEQITGLTMQNSVTGQSWTWSQ